MNKIRHLALLDAAEIFLFAPGLGDIERRRANRLHRRQSGLDQHLQLGMNGITRHDVVGIGT